MRFRPSVFAAVAAVLLAYPTGCGSQYEVQAAREEAGARKADAELIAEKLDATVAKMLSTLESLSTEKEKLIGIAARFEAGTAERLAVDKAIAAVSARLAELDRLIADASTASTEARRTAEAIAKRIEEADRIVAASGPGRNPGTEVGELIGAFIPGAAALSPILAGLFYRGFKLKKAKNVLEGALNTKSVAVDRIVASIDALAEIAPEVREAIRRNAKVLDVIQTPTGKVEVDKAQARNFSPTSA